MKYVTIRRRMKLVVLLFVVISICRCSGDVKEDANTYMSRFLADLWLEGSDVVKIIWRDCSKKLINVKDVIDHKENFPKFIRCMKRKTLRALDRSLSPDVVPIADGVNLVRYEIVDRSGNVMADNQTSSWTDKELEEGEWRMLALQRMAKVLRTHVIKFDFDNKKTVDRVEYRGRRRQHMMTMMMFGVVSIGMVIVPMGFQFLAVLGGKALLLAKMALILASIQGLKKGVYPPLQVVGGYGIHRSSRDINPDWQTVDEKSPVDLPEYAYPFQQHAFGIGKVDLPHYDYPHGYHDRGKIATSPVNYGFYHSYPPSPPYEHFEKRSQDDWPPPAVTATTTPPATSVHPAWPHVQAGNIKVDRIHIADEDVKRAQAAPEVSTAKSQARIYRQSQYEPETSPRTFTSENSPVYGPDKTSPSFTSISSPVYDPETPFPGFSSLDAPTPLTDLTTQPGEVQADFTVELPYNGFRFQNPTPVVSA